MNAKLQMENKQIQNMNEKAIELCSRCLHNEIVSWINEKWKHLQDDVRRQINEELKGIRLEQGNCIVCSSGLVSKETPEKILKILNENGVDSSVKEEFKYSFCL